MAILYIGFLALFALDVFEPGRDLEYYLVALFMHLIPNFILGAALFIAWRNERLGGILFIILGILMFAYFRNPLYINIPLFSPLFLIGFLFLLGSTTLLNFKNLSNN